jgi:hypothetical protein
VIGFQFNILIFVFKTIFMRLLIVLLMLSIGKTAIGQASAKQKEQIDRMLDSIAADKNLTSSHFVIAASKKGMPISTYTYWSKKGHIAKITKRFGIRNDSTEQTFYFSQHQLIYATEFITTYSGTKAKDDEAVMSWGGTYYFSNRKLIDILTIGHGKSEMDDWDPQLEVLTNCQAAKADIKRYLTKKRK